MTAFPETGKSRTEILAAITEHRAKDLQVDGRAFAFIYDAGQETRDLAREAFAMCMPINGLDPTVYPSARTLENAVVRSCLEIVRAPEGAVGTATAGGTESVMLAVKAAREYARKTRPEITRPAMLLPETAHACFHKASHYLGVEVIPVAVDPVTFRADLADARAKMSPNVILVVGSAPSYAHGVIDPIEDLAKLAVEHGALMHVDACVGGFVLPFMRDNGAKLPPFDFQVSGVTSMSMDVHKYGFAPKGVSVLVVRDRALRDAQYYACAEWTGYTIVNSTTLGSKSLAAVGAAYAVLQSLGREGYRAHAKAMWSATEKLVAAVETTPGLKMLGKPDMNLFAFTTEGGDIFELADRLTELGWHVQPTYAFGHSPAHIHLTVDPSNAGGADAFAKDLAAAARDLPPMEAPPAEVIGMLEAIAGGGAGVEVSTIMRELGITDGQLPHKSGMIHKLLNAASPRTREAMLVMFFGELFT